jgi:hypothetical protein
MESNKKIEVKNLSLSQLWGMANFKHSQFIKGKKEQALLNVKSIISYFELVAVDKIKSGNSQFTLTSLEIFESEVKEIGKEELKGLLKQLDLNFPQFQFFINITHEGIFYKLEAKLKPIKHILPLKSKIIQSIDGLS